MLKGIDVSSYQPNIDWGIVKNQIDYAIIRLGYGDNVESQDDRWFQYNVNGCISNNIPFGVYIYSYAKRIGEEESIDSEVEHTLRQLSKISQKPFCVYIDLEDENYQSSFGKETLTNFALHFCNKIKNNGYKAGVYANENWFRNYLDAVKIHNEGYTLWCARVSNTAPNIGTTYDIWQYSFSGRINGINGDVDLDNMINDIIDYKPTPQQFEITYQIWDDVLNRWLSNVINDRDYAGIYGHDVCCVYANSNKGNIYQRVHYKNGEWLPEVKNRTDYAGIYNKPIDGWMIRADYPIKYRCHLRRQKRWLPWVTGYSTKDSNNGYAGIIGQEIDCIQVKPIE